MSQRSYRSLLAFIVIASGCGDGGEDARPDAGEITDAAARSPDAEPTAEPDAAAPSPLVGTWHHRLHVDQPRPSGASFVFAEDGTFVFDEPPGDHMEGSYEIRGDLLVLDGTNGATALHVETSYYLAGDLLLIEALLPEREDQDPLGTWHGTLRLDAVEGGETDRFGTEVSLTLAAGGTGELVEDHYTVEDEEPETREITWTSEDGVLSYPGPFGPVRHLVIDTAAMSTQALDRAR